MRLPSCLPVALVALVFGAGCAPSIDVAKTLHVVDISGGYHDAGPQPDGRNKVVPSVTFRLTKSTSKDVGLVSLNLAFKKLPLPGTPPPAGSPSGTPEDWDEFYIQKVDFKGNSTDPLTVRSKAGYTGEPPMTRAEILTNHLFQDVLVVIFAKQSSSNWVKIAEYRIPRKLAD